MYPKFISIFWIMPYISLALSNVISEVWEVGAKLENDKTLQVWASVVKFFCKIFKGSSYVFNSNPLLGMHNRVVNSYGYGLSLQNLE